MLTIQEIRQLSDRDITDELSRTRSASFRQQVSIRTGHLKDSHKIRILKKYIARLLTIIGERKKSGVAIEESVNDVVKKLKDSHAELEKHQIAGKKKTDKEERLAHEAKHKERVAKEIHEDDISEKSTAKVKVKMAEKKEGLLGKIFKKRDA